MLSVIASSRDAAPLVHVVVGLVVGCPRLPLNPELAGVGRRARGIMPMAARDITRLRFTKNLQSGIKKTTLRSSFAPTLVPHSLHAGG